MSRNDRFLKACRMETADCTPVWFMRQAGRYMKAYRDIREKRTLMEMFKTPDIAARVTLQPVDAFDVDAAIIFADILLPLEAMGLPFDFAPGPVFERQVRTEEDIRSLSLFEPEESLGYVLEALRMARAELAGRAPLIGFAGAPFTLAGYAIDGGSSSSFAETKRLMYGDGALWGLLMSKLTVAIIRFLKAQVKAGAQVVQLFDSWVGCLSPSDYDTYVLPFTLRIFEELKKEGIPSIHFGTATAGLLPLMAEAGGDVLGVDWRIRLGRAWESIGHAAGIQGNLDPVALLAAPRNILEEKTREILEDAAGRPGHIFNLGHGILPSTPEDSVKAVTNYVHEHSSRTRE